MSIVIYSYHNPYSLKDNQELWDEIVNCPYFCVSQTLVNGLKTLYGKDFQINRVTTVKNLTDAVYRYWTGTACAVKQHADIDNIISMASERCGLNADEVENIRKSFLFNRNEVFNSIRTMFELRMNPNNIVEKYLTPEQKFIVFIFNEIINSARNKDFLLKDNFTEQEIEEAIMAALQIVKENSGNASESIGIGEFDHIVIHGVHQFSSLMLRTIEEIAKYKKVILLFNYQEQYKNIYQTWIDIYSSFDCKMVDFKENEFHPTDSSTISYEGNMLAQNMGKLLEGRKEDITVQKPYEIIEFDNMTEFAGYVAKIFEEAERRDPEYPMSAMSEQIYAADSSANDILKIYFPEQFGERQFLNYPLGHFFIAVANMWDSETNGILISDINDIRECLSAGILAEKTPGRLASIFGKMESLFVGCLSVDEMLSRLKKVKKNKKFISDDKRLEYISHISYYSVSKSEIKELEQALNDLEELASFFYEDFEKRPNNFKAFYKKLKQYLREEILDERDLGDEFTDIINRVLTRLDEIEDIRLNEEWVNFIVQNYAVIMGWLRFNKALFIQDRNPGVPGVMYKVAPETEEKHKSLKKARKLWIATVDVTGNPLYEIYTGSELSIEEFDLDHFVPRSYVSNDELWNLTPMAKKLNSSKNNKLPAKGYIKNFVEYNYYLYSLIFDNGNKDQAAILKHCFDQCENQHLNAVWATEKLYIPGNSKEQFENILEENLSLVYDSAKLQEYEMWVI